MRVQKGAVNAENNQFIGVSRGGKTTKIHAVVDGLGNPVCFMLTGGQVHDSKAAVDVLSGINISGSNILGDKAYGTEKSELTLPSKMQNTPFRQGKTFLTRGIVIIGCIRNVIWSSAFSIKSKLFAELLLVMISLLHRFLLSYTSLPFGFCLNNTTFLSFQIRSSITPLYLTILN